LSRELAAIADHFAEADAAAHRAAVHEQHGDRDAALQERDAALGAYNIVSMVSSELFLFLLRHALHHNPEAVRTYLINLLADQPPPVPARKQPQPRKRPHEKHNVKFTVRSDS